MKRIIVLFFLFFLTLVGLLIARLNADPVVFDFYLSTFDVPLIVLLYGTLVIGVMLGTLISLYLALKAKRETSRLRKRLALREQEVKNLREIPIKGRY